MEPVDFLKDLSIYEISMVNRYIEPNEKYPFKNAGRFHHGFMFTISGEECYCFSDKKIRAVPGSVLYVPKGEKYTIKLEGEISEVITIDFETEKELPCRPFFIKLSFESEIRHLFEEMEKQWMKKKIEDNQMMKSCFYKLVALLLRKESTYSFSKNYSKISSAIEYLHENFLDNNFHIQNLFEIAGISPKYFETLFFNEFNTTPKKYVTALKIKQAKELLLSEKISINDVATRLGYADMYHFSKTFKAETGYTPTEFRKGSQNIKNKT